MFPSDIAGDRCPYAVFKGNETRPPVPKLIWISRIFGATIGKSPKPIVRAGFAQTQTDGGITETQIFNAKYDYCFYEIGQLYDINDYIEVGLNRAVIHEEIDNEIEKDD